MGTNENWPEIVDSLRPYLKGAPAKEKFLKETENSLKILGWRKTNGTMVSHSPADGNPGGPDLLLLKQGETTGLQAFPVMTEPPTFMNHTAGLYAGENIRLYYKAPARENTPVCVLTAEIREDDANGPLLCDLLSFKAFNLKSMENFCLRRYNLMRTGGSFRQWTEDFLSGDTGVENLAGLLMEKFMAEGFEESLVREELDRLDLRVRYEKGHAAITLRNPA